METPKAHQPILPSECVKKVSTVAIVVVLMTERLTLKRQHHFSLGELPSRKGAVEYLSAGIISFGLKIGI
ncbi:unnamed protein product [Brugia timori]|uniref:Uncharacterized protein n=1 Tax=Brugia timori TaxID=42155 RepID=A0A0R3QGQ7_9BILA|nr:unnamed protein product [Brugia timori]